MSLILCLSLAFSPAKPHHPAYLKVQIPGHTLKAIQHFQLEDKVLNFRHILKLDIRGEHQLL